MLEVAALLEDRKELPYVCVTSLSEALTLRLANFKKPILVLSIIDKDPALAALHAIDLACHTKEQLDSFIHAAQKAQKPLKIHFKIDTGLSRLGALWSEAETLLHCASKAKECIVQGIFTHLADSDSDDLEFAHLQLKRFKTIIESAAKKNIHFRFRHASCSAAATVLDNSPFTMIRLGIGLYGLWPSPENRPLTQARFPEFSLTPVMTWKTRIIQLKTVPAKTSVGYDRTFTTQRTTTLATLPIGYYDGYNRLLSNKGVVKIGPHYAPVVGQISMNLTTVDVTDIPNIRVGDEVILLGKETNINAETHASLCGTINYEIVTRINPSIHRTHSF